jgi:hypothetical protein
MSLTVHGLAAVGLAALCRVETSSEEPWICNSVPTVEFKRFMIFNLGRLMILNVGTS